MQDKIYTHLVRSYDGAGKRKTTWHESLAEAITEQTVRVESDGHFDVIVLPVITETVSLPRLGEAVAVYREMKARKAVAANDQRRSREVARTNDQRPRAAVNVRPSSLVVRRARKAVSS